MKIFFLSLFFLSAFCQAEIKDQRTLTLGQYPYFSPEMMQHRMQPLADYYQRKTGYKILVENATSYEQFLSNAKLGEYDIAFAPAHFAALLCSDYHYQPQLLFDVGYSALIASLEKNNIKNPKDLIGKKISIPNPQALVTRIALKELAKLNINSTDIILLKKSTHDRALHALFTGEADAAIISTTVTAALPIETLKKLHVVEVYGDVLGDIVIVNKKAAELIKGSTIDFPNSQEAKNLIKRWKFDLRLRPINNSELLLMKELAPE